MAERRKIVPCDPEAIRQKVAELITNFEHELRSGELRSKVLALVPIFHQLRDLGKSLIPTECASAARDRILYYFRQYPGTIIHGDELLVVSGIQEYARRLRELRVQFGWAIMSGVTIKEMSEDDQIPDELKCMKPNEYVLLNTEQDREAAHRYNIANTIRKKNKSVRDKILEFLRENVGRPVTNEELRYVAGDKSEWARRVRELRTEEGWPIVTKSTGRPELGIGVYILEADRQTPKHDRRIPDAIRRDVLRRDEYKCQKCNWSHKEWNPSDPRHLELHHIRPHAEGGPNVQENLQTLCNKCHDEVHRREKQ
ncbi:HNH endonuclease [Desulfacinum hydrothermale DSM 13146]|uniref:HNH endonuclease n=1 Tax=Desulfacinum hydrothermale DSM 13146 TaxID=1121390 RepID=A0A1W1XX36_9BACT|nr:HNH endonuclease signature motif containing protein [Desulfacinum hydrothermale]SMC28529.1 HNH endonuclease [Desulfacinum hydrothermale DSM 13146]